MGKMTKAQLLALDGLSRRGDDCGYVNALTAKALEKKGLIERYGPTRLQDWWSITEAGRATLRKSQGER